MKIIEHYNIGAITMNKTHAIVIGLDGMPLHAFYSLFEQGLMPYTKHLWQKLWSSNLKIMLPFTLPSWTTISTGVNPGKHGIFDFLKPLPGKPPKIITKDDVAYPTLPEMLAYNKLPSITINVPLTYPPATRRRDCVVISDWTIPKKLAWPKDEEERVRKLLPPGPPTKPLTIESYLETVAVSIRKRLELLEYYFIKRNWRLFYTVIPEPDWIFHKVYSEAIVEKKSPKPVKTIFQLIDKFIKLVVENMPDNTLLILCSDHGFSVARISINGNVILKKMGLLKTREEGLNIKSLTLLSLAKIIPPRIKHSIKYKAHVAIQALTNIQGFEHRSIPIDYVNSKAFMTISYNLYLNPGLSPQERRIVLDKILSLYDSIGGLLKDIIMGKRAFKGPYSENAPDIILIPKEGVNISTRLLSNKVIEKGKWYIHSNVGFIALNMEPCASEFRDVDIAPTVLAYLGLPIPADIDGSIIIPIKPTKRINYGPHYIIAKKILKSHFVKRTY